MFAEPFHANPRHRYALPAAAYLSDAEEARYVAIAPGEAGFLVERGTLAAGPVGGPPGRLPAAPSERFPPDALAVAVQRVCALAAAWLDYDEREVEQTRELFRADPSAPTAPTK